MSSALSSMDIRGKGSDETMTPAALSKEEVELANLLARVPVSVTGKRNWDRIEGLASPELKALFRKKRTANKSFDKCPVDTMVNYKRRKVFRKFVKALCEDPNTSLIDVGQESRLTGEDSREPAEGNDVSRSSADVEDDSEVGTLTAQELELAMFVAKTRVQLSGRRVWDWDGVMAKASPKLKKLIQKKMAFPTFERSPVECLIKYSHRKTFRKYVATLMSGKDHPKPAIEPEPDSEEEDDTKLSKLENELIDIVLKTPHVTSEDWDQIELIASVRLKNRIREKRKLTTFQKSPLDLLVKYTRRKMFRNQLDIRRNGSGRLPTRVTTRIKRIRRAASLPSDERVLDGEHLKDQQDEDEEEETLETLSESLLDVEKELGTFLVNIPSHEHKALDWNAIKEKASDDLAALIASKKKFATFKSDPVHLLIKYNHRKIFRRYLDMLQGTTSSKEPSPPSKKTRLTTGESTISVLETLMDQEMPTASPKKSSMKTRKKPRRTTTNKESISVLESGGVDDQGIVKASPQKIATTPRLSTMPGKHADWDKTREIDSSQFSDIEREIANLLTTTPRLPLGGQDMDEIYKRASSPLKALMDTKKKFVSYRRNPTDLLVRNSRRSEFRAYLIRLRSVGERKQKEETAIKAPPKCAEKKALSSKKQDDKKSTDSRKPSRDSDDFGSNQKGGALATSILRQAAERRNCSTSVSSKTDSKVQNRVITNDGGLTLLENESLAEELGLTPIEIELACLLEMDRRNNGGKIQWQNIERQASAGLKKRFDDKRELRSFQKYPIHVLVPDPMKRGFQELRNRLRCNPEQHTPVSTAHNIENTVLSNNGSSSKEPGAKKPSDSKSCKELTDIEHELAELLVSTERTRKTGSSIDWDDVYGQAGPRLKSHIGKKRTWPLFEEEPLDYLVLPYLRNEFEAYMKMLRESPSMTKKKRSIKQRETQRSRKKRKTQNLELRRGRRVLAFVPRQTSKEVNHEMESSDEEVVKETSSVSVEMVKQRLTVFKRKEKQELENLISTFETSAREHPQSSDLSAQLRRFSLRQSKRIARLVCEVGDKLDSLGQTGTPNWKK